MRDGRGSAGASEPDQVPASPESANWAEKADLRRMCWWCFLLISPPVRVHQVCDQPISNSGAGSGQSRCRAGLGASLAVEVASSTGWHPSGVRDRARSGASIQITRHVRGIAEATPAPDPMTQLLLRGGKRCRLSSQPVRGQHREPAQQRPQGPQVRVDKSATEWSGPCCFVWRGPIECGQVVGHNLPSPEQNKGCLQ